jgi:hypothetical protein
VAALNLAGRDPQWCRQWNPRSGSGRCDGGVRPFATALWAEATVLLAQLGRDRLQSMFVERTTVRAVYLDALLAGPLAQLAEQQTLNLRVEGSIPSRLTTYVVLSIYLPIRSHSPVSTMSPGSGGVRRWSRVRIAASIATV